MPLRDYQQQAVDTALASKNGILVLPTGSGKSHVIAGIVEAVEGNVIVLQPTREILESNLEKIQMTGLPDVRVFSASMDSKEIGRITYATIGSIIKIADQLTDCSVLIIDECHLVNAKGGQYEQFIKTVNPDLLIGLTATPYRLHSNQNWGSQQKVLTRTRPKIFKKIIHVTQSRDLVDRGDLVEPTFIVSGHDHDNILAPNSTGAEYADYSIQRYFDDSDLVGRIGTVAEEAVSRDLAHLLVFVSSIEQGKVTASELCLKGISAECISSKDAAGDRRMKLKDFRSGEIRALTNCGILTTGYDFPRLDCIIGARPTMSLALYYQMIGREVRPHPEKIESVVYDLVDNYSKFGNPMDFRVVNGSTGLACVLSEQGRLTGRYTFQGPEVDDEMEFGRHRGTKLKDMPADYMRWYLGDRKKDGQWHQFDVELMRREIWGDG